jgi:hypothetical protein
LALTKLITFTTSKNNERYEKKYQAFKECGHILTTFIEKKKELIEKGSYYLKTKELYSVLEIYENFDQVFEYIKNRLNAIRDVFEQSGQFNNLLETLNSKIQENENRFMKLISQYEKVLKEFENFGDLFKDIQEIDNIVKKKNLII